MKEKKATLKAGANMMMLSIPLQTVREIS